MKRREVPIGLSCILTFMKLLFEKILLDEPLNFGGCVLCLAAFDNVADHLVRHRRMLHPRVGAILPASTIMSPVCQYDGILQGRTALVYERDGGLCSRLDDQTCGGGRYVTLVEHVVMVIDETGCTVVVHSIFLLRTRWELHMLQHPCTCEVDAVVRMLLIVGAGRKGEKQQKACDDVIIFHTIICF